MKISSNMVGLGVVANMNKANNSAGNAMQRLSSGLKINKISDDPAGWAIANRLDAQISGLNQANKNSLDAISFVQTAEGALSEVHSMLNRMKELTVQGLNGTLSADDKQKIQFELDELNKEVSNIQKTTAFNDIDMLNQDGNTTMQIGANAYETMEINGADINLDQVVDIIKDFSLDRGVDDLLTKIDDAVEMTSTIRGRLGAYQNRLEHTTTNLGVSEENMTSSLSRIQDADMAEEMTEYTLQNVIAQAGVAMLAQANQRPQQVLQLLNS